MSQPILATFHVITFGCQMNEYDSRKVVAKLVELGWQYEDNLRQAEVVIVNTCSVRHSAEARALGQLSQLKRLKTHSRAKILAVIGCMAERMAERLVEVCPHIDLVVGAKCLHLLPQALLSAWNGHTPQVLVGDQKKVETDWLCQFQPNFSTLSPLAPAYVSIMRGCNNFCAFCVVPAVRGREVYRPVEEILKEVFELSRAGAKEIILIGQNANAYRWEGIDFAGLLDLVTQLPTVHRIRFVTSHPKSMTFPLVDYIATNPKICEHIHLPLQAGSDRVLQLMNRRYTYAHYKSLVERFRQVYAGRGTLEPPALVTDIIVGFPGETEEDFQATLRAVEEIEWDGAFTFKYSPRPGTQAYQLGDIVPPEVKQDRFERLLVALEAVTQRKSKNMINKTVEAVIEETRISRDKHFPNRTFFSGHTRNGKLIYLDVSELPVELRPKIGDIVQVKVKYATLYTLYSEPIVEITAKVG